MRSPILFTIAALLLAGRAAAATLETAPIVASFTGNYLLCYAQNVSAQPQHVDMSILDFDGDVVSGPDSYTIAPGETQSIAANLIPGAASYRFAVAGSAHSIRASASYYDPNAFRTTIAVPAE
jgi:hypothetical protein